MKNIFLALIFLASVFTVKAQADFIPKGSFNLEIALPNNVTNNAFKDLFQGLAAVTPSYQYTFDNTFSIGAGFRYGYFNVNEFRNNLDLKGGLHIMGAFLKVGQEKYYGNFGLDYGIRMGYSMNFFDTNKNKESIGKAYQNDGLFFEPNIGLALKSGDNSSFRFVVGYAFHTIKVGPEHVGVDQFAGIDQDKLNQITTYFTVGFGYSYYFGKK